MNVRVSLSLVLALTVVMHGCKTTGPSVSGAKDDQLQATGAGSAVPTASTACHVDPQALATQMYSSPTYYNSGPAKAFIQQSAADVKRLCTQGSDASPVGFSDPVCGQYCDACTAGLGSDAQTVYAALATPLYVAKAFAAYGPKFKPLADLANNVAGIYKTWNNALNLDKTLLVTGCAASLYDMGKTIYYFSGAGSTQAENIGRLLCDANAATNACVLVPGVGPALAAYDTAVLANPLTALLKAGITLDCAVAPFIANTLIKCPALKSACLGAVTNAQAIDNTACCVCGNLLDGSTTVLSQTWGGSAYGSPDTCEQLDDAGVRAKVGVMPVGGQAACLRVPIDRVLTRGCSLQRVVYGSNISCNKDRDVYCVDQPIVTADGTTLHAPEAPLLGECTKYLSRDDLDQLITSYAAPVQSVSISVGQASGTPAN